MVKFGIYSQQKTPWFITHLGLILLFVSAFAAATILPLQSEAMLLAILTQQQYLPWLVISVASVANIMGSCVNWYLGSKAEQYKDKKWFPVSAETLHSAQVFYQKYGFWSLFLSWTPIIGDPLTLIAGLLKESFWRFLLIVCLAKTGRYVSLYLLWLVL